MFQSLRQDLAMLHNSRRHIVLFEITYKLAAIALLYPVMLMLLELVMKVANIHYFTNEYIAIALTHPVVILGILLFLCTFAIYCGYEMCFLCICFEAHRCGSDVSILENVKTTGEFLTKRIGWKQVGIAFWTVLAVFLTNTTVLCNVFYSQTTLNLLKTAIQYGAWYYQVSAAAALLILYAAVVLGIYSFHVFFLERKNFKESYCKSVRMVRKHWKGTLSALIGYNLGILVIIGALYCIISGILIAGVRILDMAYIGSTLYLSALRYVRLVTKIVLVCIALPVSFSVITRRYYKYTNVDEIDFTVIYLKEKRHRIHKVVYYMILIGAICANVIYLITGFNKKPFDRVAIFHETTVTAHRGGAYDAPENTMVAFENAIASKADCIELDVRQTADGAIVVMHDASAYRTTGVDRMISDMTLEEVKQLDAGSSFRSDYAGEQVPTLEEVLTLTKGKIHLNIEIKTSVKDVHIAQEIVTTLERFDMIDECVITSFDLNVLKQAKACNDQLRVGYILSVAYGDFYDNSEVDFFSMNASFLSKRLVDAIHRSGKQVYAWTVNNESSIRNLANKGVDDIITDKPGVAKETLLSRDTSETLLNMAKYVFNQ